MPSNAAPFSVAARAIAPPVLPIPPETTSLPARSPPQCFRAAATRVWYAVNSASCAPICVPPHRAAQRQRKRRGFGLVPIHDQDACRVSVSAKNSHRLAGSDQQALLVLKLFKSFDKGVETWPIPRHAPGSSAGNQFLPTLGHRRVQAIHQHAQRGFLMPSFAGELFSCWGVNGLEGGQCLTIF